MVKFGGKTEDGRHIVGIGLSRENCNRLLKDQPIVFPIQEVGVPPDEFQAVVIVVAGENEIVLAHELRRLCTLAGVPVKHLGSEH